MHRIKRHLAAAACAWLGLALLLGLLLGAPGQHVPAAPDALELALVGLSSSLALGAFALAGALAQQGSPRTALGLARGWRGLPAWWVGALVLGLIGCSHLVHLALSLTPLYETSMLDAIERGLRDARGAELALVVGGIAIAPGVCEELLFRGLLLRGIARRFGSGAAVLSTSFLFAALHLDPVQGPGAFLLGLYLGAVAVATGGTAVPILCHVANNLAAVAAAVTGAGELSSGASGALALASSAAALLGLLALRRMRWPRAPSRHGAG